MLLGRYADLLYNGTNWILLATGAEAAAFDAYAFNGIQINGSMEVSQERGLGGVALPPATAVYAIDNFLAVNLGATRSGSAGCSS